MLGEDMSLVLKFVFCMEERGGGGGGTITIVGTTSPPPRSCFINFQQLKTTTKPNQKFGGDQDNT